MNVFRAILNRVWVLVALSGVAASLSTSARGDYLAHEDGRLLRGEVLAQDERTVTFRHKVGQIWTTMVFERRHISALEVEAGDQSDRKTPPPKSSPKPGENDQTQEASSQKKHVDLKGALVVVQLHGTVGGVENNSLMNTFDAEGLVACFKQAFDGDAAAVVLDIHSPGGMVSEMEAICSAILDWQTRLRVIAYPQDALSAAAVITLCCEDIVVRSESRIGAAVIIRTDGSGNVDALDAKLASPHHAQQKQFMTRCGRPYDLLQAMTIQECQLWWNAEDGFRSGTPGNDKEWDHVDNTSTVLTMTADEAVRWKVALGHANGMEMLLRRTGLNIETPVVNITDTLRERNKKLERELAGLNESFEQYFTSLGQLVAAMNRLREAYVKRNRSNASQYKSEIRQCLGRVQHANRDIQKADKSILARRVTVPEAALKQMETDAALLGRITQLLSRDTVDGYNESVERLNAVLASWRAILK